MTDIHRFAASALFIVLLVGGCARPSWLGLATATAGAPIGKADRVVVLLHGYGAPADDLLNMAEQLVGLGVPAGTAFIIPEGPRNAGAGRCWWSSEAQKDDARVRVSKLLAVLRKKSRLPASRVVVGGFSQGGILAMDVALREPEPPGGVLVLSGRLDGADPRTSHDKPLRFFISHGRGDPVIPFSEAMSAQQRLLASGHVVDFEPFEGSHQIPLSTKKAVAALIGALP